MMGCLAALTTKTIDESEREDSGRGLVCKETINQGNSLFYLPMTIVLDKEKAVEVRSIVGNMVESPCTLLYPGMGLPPDGG